MTTERDETELALPGLEQPSAWSPLSSAPGPLELALDKQLDALRREELLGDLHAGRVELARSAARDLDRSVGRGAPSGRANLLRVYNEILDGLPQPETAAANTMDELAALLRDGESVPNGHEG